MLTRGQAATGTQKAEEKLRRAYETRNECQRVDGEFLTAIPGRVLDLSQIGNACMYWHYDMNVVIPHPFITPFYFFPQIRDRQPLRSLCLRGSEARVHHPGSEDGRRWSEMVWIGFPPIKFKIDTFFLTIFSLFF